jgi:hypothetical protein
MPLLDKCSSSLKLDPIPQQVIADAAGLYPAAELKPNIQPPPPPEQPNANLQPPPPEMPGLPAKPNFPTESGREFAGGAKKKTRRKKLKKLKK